MAFKFNVDLSLNGLRVETGINDRLVGMQADQTLVQDKDLAAAQAKVTQAKDWIASKLPKGKAKQEVVATPIETPTTA